MSKLAQFPLLVLAVAFTTASTPLLPPVQPVMTLVPVAIIDGGTVSTVPKGVKRNGGKVVILRGRADRTARSIAASKKAAASAPARGRDKAVARDAAVVSGGGSPADAVELRQSEPGLRVMIIGPDGLTRTRYVPASPGTIARDNQDD